MKHLLATTALAAMLAGPALAQTHKTAEGTMAGSTRMQEGAAPFGPTFVSGDNEIRASNLIGMEIYTDSGAEGTAAAVHSPVAEPGPTWKSLGDVEDVLISSEGRVSSVVADVGGFLTMGEHEVEIPLDELAFIPDADDEGEFFVIYTGNPSQFREAGMFDRNGAFDRGYRSVRDTMGFDGPDTVLQPIDLADLTTEDLEGAPVYGPDNERIGEIDTLVLGAEGKVAQAVIDVGGFLGIGEKPVALDIKNITFKHNDVDDTTHAFVQMTQEQLETLPEYAGN